MNHSVSGTLRLDPPSRTRPSGSSVSEGHPSGSSVSGTSVWILRLRDIRLDIFRLGDIRLDDIRLGRHPSEPPSRGHPSRILRLRDIRLGDLRLGDIRLNPPSQGHPSRRHPSPRTSVWILQVSDDIRLDPPSRTTSRENEGSFRLGDISVPGTIRLRDIRL